MDLAKYAALFLAESREHLGTCNRLLLAWERVPADPAPVGGLFRAVHTVKGMAATMAYGHVADLAHRTENLLDALRAGRVTPDGAIFELLFRAVDALGIGVEAAGAGQEAAVDDTLLAALDEATHRGAPAATGGAQLGDTPAGGVDAAVRGRPVQVVLRSDRPLRGPRALLVLRKAEALGAVTAVHPPLVVLDQEAFDGRLSFQLETAAADAEIAAAIMAAGDVQSVRFDVVDPAAGAAQRAGRGSGRQIRVDLGRLDALMRQVGELVVARNRLAALAVAAQDPALAETSARISRLVSEMQGEVIAARMTPVGEVFERFPRLVRDLGRELGKQIRIETEGGEIELDRSVLDEIGEPLLHLVRNAADHGIEAPALREAAGKPAEGRILLSASRDRNVVTIRVADDGRGIDREAVAVKAKREGFTGAGGVDVAELDRLTDDGLIRLLARPGFSTAQAVSDVSGRGVGVDVAMTRVRALGGTLEVRSEPGRGTTFVIRVPFTLAIVRAVLAYVGGERYAIPLAYVAETVEFDERALTSLRGRDALVLRDQVVPTVHLRDLVGATVGATADAGRARRPTVILEVGDRRTALVVDGLAGQQEIVVEPFDAPRGMSSIVGGATILADGAPALILDAAAIL